MLPYALELWNDSPNLDINHQITYQMWKFQSFTFNTLRCIKENYIGQDLYELHEFGKSLKWIINDNDFLILMNPIILLWFKFLLESVKHEGFVEAYGFHHDWC